MVFPRRNWTPLPTLLLLFRLFIFLLQLPSTVPCAYCGMLFMIIIFHGPLPKKLKSWSFTILLELLFLFLSVKGHEQVQGLYMVKDYEV